MTKINTRKDLFIDALADYLTRDLGDRSIRLQMNDPNAQEWAKLYQAAGLHGYATKKEAVKALREMLV